MGSVVGRGPGVVNVYFNVHNYHEVMVYRVFTNRRGARRETSLVSVRAISYNVTRHVHRRHYVFLRPRVGVHVYLRGAGYNGPYDHDGQVTKGYSYLVGQAIQKGRARSVLSSAVHTSQRASAGGLSGHKRVQHGVGVLLYSTRYRAGTNSSLIGSRGYPMVFYSLARGLRRSIYQQGGTRVYDRQFRSSYYSLVQVDLGRYLSTIQKVMFYGRYVSNGVYQGAHAIQGEYYRYHESYFCRGSIQVAIVASARFSSLIALHVSPHGASNARHYLYSKTCRATSFRK